MSKKTDRAHWAEVNRMLAAEEASQNGNGASVSAPTPSPASQFPVAAVPFNGIEAQNLMNLALAGARQLDLDQMSQASAFLVRMRERFDKAFGPQQPVAENRTGAELPKRKQKA